MVVLKNKIVCEEFTLRVHLSTFALDIVVKAPEGSVHEILDDGREVRKLVENNPGAKERFVAEVLLRLAKTIRVQMNASGFIDTGVIAETYKAVMKEAKWKK